MALLTPSSLNHVISLSIFSRILVFIIQLASNVILTDHHADAYRNKYYRALTRNTLNGSDVSISSVDWYFYRTIQGFTKWDAQYFLEITNDGYIGEQHLAFLPLFPVSISLIRQLIFERKNINFDHLLPATKQIPTFLAENNPDIPLTDLENYIRSAVVGFSLNNFIFFPLACTFLFTLTKLVKRRDEKYAKNVVWWFCFNPASIFFSACYTESLFALLTFAAMFVIEYKASNYLAKHEENNQELGRTSPAVKGVDYQPLSHLNRLLHICLPCLALLALSTATRSNGLITIGFLGYQFLLKYAPIAQINRASWSLMIYISLVLEFVQDILVLLMSSVVAASGYITFQIYSYIKFCGKGNSNKKGILNMRPDWCDNFIPHPYSRVQAKYWNVGVFSYYQAKQLPNFLLALPMSYLVLVGALKKSQNIAREFNGKRQLVYYLQAIILTIFCGISINVQVTTRLLASSCPAIYWICADTAEQSRSKNKVLTGYFLLYFILGTVLHANFYPWT